MAKSDPRMQGYDEQTRYSGLLYVLMLVLAAAFAGFIWNMYAGNEAPPRIAAPSGAYKTAPPPEMETAADAAEENALFESLEGQSETAEATPRAGPEAPVADDAPRTGAPQLGAAPRFVANGPYLAQVAALQSEEAVEPAWARLASRAPDLFASARLDIERADLGQRGVYYRVRAGYFADRANASRFCERVQRMGQDCIVVAR